MDCDHPWNAYLCTHELRLPPVSQLEARINSEVDAPLFSLEFSPALPNFSHLLYSSKPPNSPRLPSLLRFDDDPFVTENADDQLANKSKLPFVFPSLVPKRTDAEGNEFSANDTVVPHIPPNADLPLEKSARAQRVKRRAERRKAATTRVAYTKSPNRKAGDCDICGRKFNE